MTTVAIIDQAHPRQKVNWVVAVSDCGQRHSSIRMARYGADDRVDRACIARHRMVIPGDIY